MSRSLLLGSSLLFLSSVPCARTEDDLERARKLLDESAEKTFREGADLCVRQDSAPAADLLLEYLRLDSDRGGFLPSAHYRDVVWDGLRRLTAPAARARVLEELEENQESELVRQWCAELLGEYADPSFAGSLTAALKDKDLGVRRAAARALGKLRFETDGQPAAAAAVDALAKHHDDKDPILRANAREATACIDPAGARASLLAGLEDRDAGVRCALLGAAAKLYPDEAETLAVVALADEDWRPRMQAVDVLAKLDTASAIGRLIATLDDARPAISARALRRLQEVTGLLHTRKEAWEEWWKTHGDGFDPKRKPPKVARDPDSTVTTYNGIELVSDHVAFLIDKSNGMAATLTSRESTKGEAALQELETTLSRLHGRLDFNVFTYAEHVTPFQKKGGALALNARNQEKALAFVRDEREGGSKDIWQALESALADPELDTIYLLSSGEPDIGLYVHWNRVTWHLAEINRFRKVVVHAIAYSDSKWYRDQLEKIAEATGGEFRYFE